MPIIEIELDDDQLAMLQLKAGINNADEVAAQLVVAELNAISDGIVVDVPVVSNVVPFRQV
jgi:hypothetical protein